MTIMTVTSYGVLVRLGWPEHVMLLALGLLDAGHYHPRMQTSLQVTQTVRQMRFTDLGLHCSEPGPPNRNPRAKHMVMNQAKDIKLDRQREGTDCLPPSLQCVVVAIRLLCSSISQLCCDNKQSLNLTASNPECLSFHHVA